MRFFLIDKIDEWNLGATAKATKNVALSEDFFDDHFPRRPVMPGVLIIEGMAQLSGLLLEVMYPGGILCLYLLFPSSYISSRFFML